MYNRGLKEKTLIQDILLEPYLNSPSLLSLSSGVCLEVRGQALVETFYACFMSSSHLLT